MKLHHSELELIQDPMRTARLRQGLSTEDELRIRFKRYHRDHEKLKKKLIASGVFEHELGRYLPPYPHEFNNLTCGAKTRAGTPCKMKSIFKNGRCKLHGGLSTGPLTTQGKLKVSKNGLIIKKKSKALDT